VTSVARSLLYSDAMAVDRDASNLFAVAFLVWIIVILLRAWEIMILIGIFHSETGWPPQTIGFWISIPIALLLTGLTQPVSTRSES
jgi:hypothetical protein